MKFTVSLDTDGLELVPIVGLPELSSWFVAKPEITM
jgi:hypothetical protein